MADLSCVRQEGFGRVKAFHAEPFYNPEGDCLVCYSSDEPSSRERVDQILTVYRGVVTKQIVGFQVKGIRSLVRKYRGLAMTIRDRPVNITVEYVLLVSFMEAQGRSCDPRGLPVRRSVYERLLEDVGPRTIRLTAEVRALIEA